jgi:homopolymeric O-antigen transport system permease protein
MTANEPTVMSPRPAWIRSVWPLALADLRHRYAGSALGGLWAITAPLLEVAAYALIFGFLLPSDSRATGLSYAIFIASGLLPWTALRETLEASAGTLLEHRWIRRSRVPVELLVARHVAVGASRAVVGIVIVIAVSLVTHGAGSSLRTLPVLLLALALQVAIGYGLGLALAPLGTLYPDLRPGLVSLLMLLTFASPILYPETALGPRALALVEWNPFTHLLRLYRLPLALPGSELRGTDLAWPAVAAAAVVGAGLFLKDRFWWAARDAL